MNVGQLKNPIKDIPDDYSVRIDVESHPDDLPDILEEHLVATQAEKNASLKMLFIYASSWTAIRKSNSATTQPTP